VLAKHVLAYDLCRDGSLVYTDGTRVYHASAGQAGVALCKARMIEAVVSL
jgi:hypothetical protein